MAPINIPQSPKVGEVEVEMWPQDSANGQIGPEINTFTTLSLDDLPPSPCPQIQVYPPIEDYRYCNIDPGTNHSVPTITMGSLAVPQPSAQTQNSTQTSSSTGTNLASHSAPTSQNMNMESVLHTPLNQLESSLQTLTTTFTSNPTYAAAPAALSSLLAADSSLTTALHTLKTHQNNYARILRLRAQAESLEQKVKDTVRDCIDIRRQVGEIHPGNLRGVSASSRSGQNVNAEEDLSSDSESESDIDNNENLPSGQRKTKRKRQDVNYAFLLPFAARLGHYTSPTNPQIQSPPATPIGQIASPRPNGINITTPAALTPAAAATPAPPAEASVSLIPPHEKAWLDSESTLLSDRGGMAFPAAETLRMGLLGRVQLARERGGEKGVEDLLSGLGVEGMRTAGGDEAQKAEEGESVKKEVSQEPKDGRSEAGQERSEGKFAVPTAATAAAATATATTRPSEPARPKAPAPAPVPKLVKNLDLDLYNEDDDDDDD